MGRRHLSMRTYLIDATLVLALVALTCPGSQIHRCQRRNSTTGGAINLAHQCPTEGPRHIQGSFDRTLLITGYPLLWHDRHLYPDTVTTQHDLGQPAGAG